jgi:SAM-dependent MidA family methyltransferase
MMKKLIKDAIEQSEIQAIRYDTFIELALYHPEHGYYQKKSSPFGKEGDFYTSSFINEVFGQVLTDVFIEMIDTFKLPPTIIELGGGDGRFARQVHNALQVKGIHNANYYFIEQNEYHRKILGDDLASNWNFKAYSSLSSFAADHQKLEGIIFSNEFLDAHPVRVIEKIDGEIKEVCITIDDNRELVEQPYICSQEVQEWLDANTIDIKEGQRMEVPLYMNSILREIGSILHKGIMLTIDYGYTDEEWSNPARKKGSLRGYYKHQLHHNILRNVGNMDITHHVQWGEWIRTARKEGFDQHLIMKQNEFLINPGNIFNYLQTHTNESYFSQEAKKNRAIHNLISGDLLANSFDICIHGKRIDQKEFNSLFSRSKKAKEA